MAGTLIDISTGSSAWGIASNTQIYTRPAISPEYPAGLYWSSGGSVSVPLISITASRKGVYTIYDI